MVLRADGPPECQGVRKTEDGRRKTEDGRKNMKKSCKAPHPVSGQAEGIRHQGRQKEAGHPGRQKEAGQAGHQASGQAEGIRVHLFSIGNYFHRVISSD